MERKPNDRGFYLIDAQSERYFVGRVWRAVAEVKPEIAALGVGAVFWSDERHGIERFH